MDENEKKLLESLRNFDFSKLFFVNTYVDFEYNDLYPSFITQADSDGKYSIHIQNKDSNITAPKNMLKFYGENDHFEKNKLRTAAINPRIQEAEITDLIDIISERLKGLNIKLSDENNESKNEENNNNKTQLSSNEKKKSNLIKQKNGQIYDLTGYLTHQFLEGLLNDCLCLLSQNLENNNSLNFNEKELLSIIIDIIIYCANVVKNNLKYYKNAYYNRKLLIISQIHAILVSFDSLISNLSPFYKKLSTTYVDLNNKLAQVINIVHQIILASKTTNSIPLQSLIIFIKLITIQLSKGSIEKYNRDELYLILKDHMKNLDKNELIFFKSDSSIKEICNDLINDLFNHNLDSYMNEIYYSYLFSCLKCDNLEKRINALNEINDLIKKDFNRSNKINSNFKEFIDKNNILNMFLDDNTHEEIIKRSGDLFKYLSRFNCLDDNILEKLIEKQKSNNLMSDILMQIISELPKDKKKSLFKRLTQGIKLDDVKLDNIQYISKLTIACFSSNKSIDPLNYLSKKEKEKEIKPMEEENDNNYFGLSMIFDYILYNFNDKKSYKENNIDKAINSFESILNEIEENEVLGIDDILLFLNKLFENIKSNEKHNNIVQSLKLIIKLLSMIDNSFRKNFEDTLKNINEKFDIITLLINDLARYLNTSKNIYSDDEIYEGIYPHSINIRERLNLIFYFLRKNYDFLFQGKKHLERIYQILKQEKYKEERKKFYEILSRSVGKLNNTLLTEFYTDILQNNKEFDLTKINDEESINLVIKIFKIINLNESSILYDGKKIRVNENAEIEGLDMLFTLLTKNPNEFIQEKVSELLCQICLYHKNYSKELLSSYWIDFFNKINIYFDEIMKTNDKVTFNGIIKLIDKIYYESWNMDGKIMTKSDYRAPRKNFKEYHFISLDNSKIEYKLKAGHNDKFIDMRYKISYFFDIPVNNVCMFGIDGKGYNLNNDFENFISIFSEEQYFYKKGFEYIKVRIIPLEIDKMENNPKQLIENNEKIYNILINNLSLDSSNNNAELQEKEKIWNILVQLPDKNYFKNNLAKFGNKETIEEKELSKIFNINNIYIFTYCLKSINSFLESKNSDKNMKEEYLYNFIGIHYIDKLIINNLLKISIDSNYFSKIKIDCITNILKIIYKIEEYKKTRVDLKEGKIIDVNQILQKFTDIISNLIKTNNNKSGVSNLQEILYEDAEEDISELGKKIFNFIKYITNEDNTYIDFIFNNKENFINIFIKDFIKCQNEDLKESIEQYLSDNFQFNSKNFLNYLKIVLTEELFDYLVKNDKLGKYFNVISSIIRKYFENKENEKFDPNIYPELNQNLKKLVDLILNYINQEIEKLEKKAQKIIIDDDTNSEDMGKIKLFRIKENFKEELFLFLSDIISLQPKELSNYIINKVDVCDFFLIKCNLRKCVEKPLETPDSLCQNNQSKSAVHKLILNILRNTDNENKINIYKKVIGILDDLNKTGFWKTYNVNNWEIEHREMLKEKYVGLKNMTSTCYLNSIIQQLFMIPTLRETIIKIENPSTNNVLYELQLLFSALKIYENYSYDPKSFVVANNLNFGEQMDADEFYGTLIDKIEKNIKEIYCHEILDSKNENKITNYKYKNLFNYFFGIKVLDELRFVECNHKRYNEFCYYNIQVEIKNCNNLYESLNNYFKEEVMDGDNKINCEECNTKRICHKHLLLKSLPNTLVICLKRFEFDYETMLKFKLNKYFEFPFELNMKDYMIENHTEKSTEYDLTGIVVHNGVSDFGHYYDLIKSPDDNKWYKFNDESVSEFIEEDIANEAYGNKNIDDDDEDVYSDKEKGGKKNAYILFYTKRTDNNKEELEKYDLCVPPYNTENNIKKEIREIINLKMYKTWIIRNIFSAWYENFVLGLFKTNQNMKNDFECDKHNMIEEIEEEKQGDIVKKEGNDIKNMDDKVFQFLLRYYFNVVARMIKRTPDKTVGNLRDKFRSIINNCIENDYNKAKYFLEEFNNSEAIDEYLTYCHSKFDTSYCMELINKSFIILYESSDLNDENSLIYLFLNTLLTYIANNIRLVNLDNVNSILVKIINLDASFFLRYMKEKNLDDWIMTFFRRDKTNEIFNSVFNEDNLPMAHNEHFLLVEKTMNTGEDYKTLRGRNLNDEKDVLDVQFLNSLGDMQSNNNLVMQLRKNL